MVCSIATGFVSVSIYPGASYFAPDEIILAYIAGASIACMLVVVAIAHTSKMDFSFLYQWAIPLIVFALAARVLGGMVFNTAALVRQHSMLKCCSMRFSRVLPLEGCVSRAKRLAYFVLLYSWAFSSVASSARALLTLW